MEKTLSDIIKQSNEIEQQIIENEGEITDLIEVLEKDLMENLVEKAENYYMVIDKLSNAGEYYKQEAAKLSNVAKTISNLEERIKDRLKFGMVEMDRTEIIGTKLRLKLSPTKTKLVIDDEQLIPQSFKIIEYKVDKELVRAALEKNEKIPGARLEGGLSLRRYYNKGVN